MALESICTHGIDFSTKIEGSMSLLKAKDKGLSLVRGALFLPEEETFMSDFNKLTDVITSSVKKRFVSNPSKNSNFHTKSMP